MVSLWYKLRHPGQGLAIGSEKFMSNPKNLEGNPMDWMIDTGLSDEEADKAAEIDGKKTARRDDIELTCIYLAAPTSPFETPPMDGSHITVSVIGIHATSRGSVSLASTDPNELPLIDPAYLATEHDRAVIRTGAKIVAQMMESPAGQRISVGETPPGPFAPLTSKSTDNEIDERARACMSTTYHPAGSAAMGPVVDASIMPVSIGAHLQGSLYGIAERVARR